MSAGIGLYAPRAMLGQFGMLAGGLSGTTSADGMLRTTSLLPMSPEQQLQDEVSRGFTRHQPVLNEGLWTCVFCQMSVRRRQSLPDMVQNTCSEGSTLTCIC